MAELIAIAVLAGLAIVGWGAAVALRALERDTRASADRLAVSLTAEREYWKNAISSQLDARAHLAEKVAEMRREGFVEPAPLPEPRPPLPVEIEAFIAELPLEMQGEQRAWCYEQMDAQVPPAEILEELDGAGEMIETEIKRSERG